MTPAERIAEMRAYVVVDPPASAAVMHMPTAIVLLDIASAALSFINAATPKDLGTAHAALAAAVEKLGDQR